MGFYLNKFNRSYLVSIMNFNSLCAVSVIVTLVVHLNVVNSQIETNEIPKEKHNYPSPSMQILKADNGLKNIVNDMFTPTNTTLQTNFENKNTNNQKPKKKKKKKKKSPSCHPPLKKKKKKKKK